MYLAELILSIGILSLLLYGLYDNKINSLMLFTFIIAIFLILTDPFSTQVSYMLTNSYSLSSIKIFILLISIFFIFNNYKFEFTLLISSSILGMILLISSSNFLALYLALELQSLSSYLLAAYKKDSPFSTEAGLKYFILGALASGLILFGISLIYGFTGLINFEDLKLLSSFSIGSIFGFIFLIIGFLFKLAVVPFHSWLPDVYEGSPTKVMAFFATIPKLPLLIIFIKLSHITFNLAINYWQPLLIITSISSIIIGSLGALFQKKIKRFFAYSTIANIGFVFMGLSNGTIEGIESAIVYSIIYIITNLGVFTILLSINKDNFSLSDLQSISKNNPLLAISFCILLFSTAGLPPLAGFLGKLEIFKATLSESLYLLVFIAIIISVISTAYYIRLIQIMYFQNKENLLNITFNTENSIVLSITIAFLLLLIFKFSWILLIAHDITLYLIIYVYSSTG